MDQDHPPVNRRRITFCSLERGAASRASGARGGRRAYLGGLPPPEPPALFSRTIFDLFVGGVFGVFWHPDCQVWVQISPYSIFYYLTYNLLPNYSYFRFLILIPKRKRMVFQRTYNSLAKRTYSQKKLRIP